MSSITLPQPDRATVYPSAASRLSRGNGEMLLKPTRRTPAEIPGVLPDYFFGRLLPLPVPDGFPVVLGPFGGRGLLLALAMA